MNLRKATSFLIIGLTYTLVHKLLYGLFPAISWSNVGKALTTFLWIIATLAIVLFAFQWLKDLKPHDKRMRISLISIIVFTTIVICSKLPLGLMVSGGVGHRLFFRVAALMNSFAMLAFLLCLTRFVSKGTSLWMPLRLSIFAFCLTLVLSLVSSGYFISFLLTGEEPNTLPILQPLSVLVFLFTYASSIWFLFRFRHLGSYDLFTGQ